MLRLTYIAVEGHEPAVEEYPTVLEITSTDIGIRFRHPEKGETVVNYNKLIEVEFKLEVPKAFVNRSNNTMKLKKMNATPYGRATVK